VVEVLFVFRLLQVKIVWYCHAHFKAEYQNMIEKLRFEMDI
jgi:hypothetical protein